MTINLSGPLSHLSSHLYISIMRPAKYEYIMPTHQDIFHIIGGNNVEIFNFEILILKSFFKQSKKENPADEYSYVS